MPFIEISAERLGHGWYARVISRRGARETKPQQFLDTDEMLGFLREAISELGAPLPPPPPPAPAKPLPAPEPRFTRADRAAADAARTLVPTAVPPVVSPEPRHPVGKKQAAKMRAAADAAAEASDPGLAARRGIMRGRRL